MLDGTIPLSPFVGRRVLVVGVQWDELSKAPEPKRSALLATFRKIDPDVELASTLAWDIEGAGWEQALWNDGTGRCDLMLQRLQALDPKRKRPHNQIRDILIAETAIKHMALC